MTSPSMSRPASRASWVTGLRRVLQVIVSVLLVSTVSAVLALRFRQRS